MTDPLHFVAMSGSRGCIPDACEVFGSFAEAVEYLGEVFELNEHPERGAELARTGYLTLGAHFGAEYAEILPCDCGNLLSHSDTGEP